MTTLAITALFLLLSTFVVAVVFGIAWLVRDWRGEQVLCPCCNRPQSQCPDKFRP